MVGDLLQFIDSTEEKIYWLISIFFSILYGKNAVDIFIDTSKSFVKQKMKLSSWKSHQFWLNFVGSISGWVALYYLAFIRMPMVLSASDKKLGFEDGLVILIALLGITGFLPYTLSKVTSIYK